MNYVAPRERLEPPTFGLEGPFLSPVGDNERQSATFAPAVNSRRQYDWAPFLAPRTGRKRSVWIMVDTLLLIGAYVAGYLVLIIGIKWMNVIRPRK